MSITFLGGRHGRRSERIVQLVGAALVCCLAGLDPCRAEDQPAVPKEMTARELVAATRNSIVRIETIYTVMEEVEVKEGKETKRSTVEKTYTGGGTGFIVPGGFIVTNHHVVTVELEPGQTLKEFKGYRGTLAFDTREPHRPTDESGRRVPFTIKEIDDFSIDPNEFVRDMVPLELVNKDALSDLAVLRVKNPLIQIVTSLPLPLGPNTIESRARAMNSQRELMRRVDGSWRHIAEMMELYAVKFAPPDKVEVGADVVAVGFPARIAGPPTVTRGIVSGLDRELPSEIPTDLIQTDAAINRGNSGGPLFDMHGRVVGVNTFSLNHLGTPGVSFARSARTAEPFVRQLQKGPIHRVNLGFDAVVLDLEQNDLLGIAPGLLITKVAEKSIAQTAGVRPLDLLVQVGSERVSRVGDLQNALGLAGDADSLSLTVWRLPDKALQNLADGEAGIQRLRLGRVFHPDGATELASIKKISLTAKLK